MSRSPYDRPRPGYDRVMDDRRRDEARRNERRDRGGYGGPPPPKNGGMSLNTGTIAVQRVS